ncbi:hypothetical protein GCM10011611_04670 [Aliidongia dinghuensis]|uniref:Uncharacterized protein n=1 Tax=Aliidongia dinghuensis TaxID=1867774 RepID=A0A8J3E1H9_9PROT|nr:phage holin family protein [Aliidongia dinghuensis]GGF02272.1 hypothetical protein GCM10011611_04670 [Aliidongia dinghuensis]
MSGLLVAARVLLALVEREAGHRVRRAAGFGALALTGLFIGLAGLLFVLYAIMLALTPYLTPAGAAVLVGAAMILLAAIIMAVALRRPPVPSRPVERAASDLGDAAMEAGRKLGAGVELPNTVTLVLAALIAGLVAGRKL